MVDSRISPGLNRRTNHRLTHILADSIQSISAQVQNCKAPNELVLQYSNGAYKSDESDENNDNTINPINYVGNELKQRSPSFRQPVPSKRNPREMIKSLFDIQNAVKMYEVVVKRREENAHHLLWTLIVIYLINGICGKGENFCKVSVELKIS